MPSSVTSRRSGRFEMRMLPSASVRQMPSSVESIRADCSNATLRCASSLARSRRPASAEPTAEDEQRPARTAICALSSVTVVGVVRDQPERAWQAAAPAIPPRTPRSKPISATQGASVTTPSLADHEKAIIKPQVAGDSGDGDRRDEVAAAGKRHDAAQCSSGTRTVDDARRATAERMRSASPIADVDAGFTR